MPERSSKLRSGQLNQAIYSDTKVRLIADTERERLHSAVKCLQNSLDSCLTFFDFPEEEWISLRTTNVIERLNKEFKRRTKPMEIIAGENACYTLLAFISIKMEMYWRSNPVGKVHYNLPSLRNLIEGNFTQSP